MRKPSFLLLAAWVAGGGLLAPSAAAEQADVNPPLPNVLLLVDTSGSMERKSADGNLPSCDPSGASPSEKSRWIDVVEVLTGSIQNYRCHAVDRGSDGFKLEYSLGGKPPYDFQYELPYHRPLSGTCTPGPGVLPNPNAYDYPAGAIAYHAYNSTTATCTNFTQSSDGILDSFGVGLRFGLMTFDTLTNPGTGVSGTAPQYPTGVAGTWSYFLNAPAMGKPGACLTLFDQEVGARNAAAPPWEGRMVAFGDPNASDAQIIAKNQQIQEILLASRPFGATPIAGMLADARTFLWFDDRDDPLNPLVKFGPASDPYSVGDCRSTSIVLLTDGEPNLDLRPYCEELGPPNGVCPFQKPEEIAFDLAHPSDPNKSVVDTYVIGFALDEVNVNGQTVDCKNLSRADLDDAAGLCAQNSSHKELQVCCTLNRIAFNGGTERAYFANNVSDLRVALSAALSKEFDSTSRTMPAFAAASTAQDDFAASYRFFTSFEPQRLSLWSGVVERQRWLCVDDDVSGKRIPVPQTIDPLKGDDFVANVNSGLGPARQFVSVAAEPLNGSVFSERSIRPALTSDPDGLGDYGGTQYQGVAEPFVAATPPAAMNIGSATCDNLTPDQCRDLIMRWNVGLSSGNERDRCITPGVKCNLVGDIFHSTPRLVNRPADFLRDESYQQFAAAQAGRPLVLYTSSNDGFLHAFKVAPNSSSDSRVETKANNELWAFIPPAVLPRIRSQYPGSHQLLLDGVPVVKDVVATDLGGGNFRLERTLTDARAGAGSWRTILVQSFGGNEPGYFALDVTDPVIGQSRGPKFLWQLTQDINGNALFGKGGATPLITTLFFDTGNNEISEVAVAVLPGGPGRAPTGQSCPRSQTSFSHIDSSQQPRTFVNCYESDGIGGRSLTIVRLDTGEIVRTFRKAAADAPAGLSQRVTLTGIDSPITGQPVAFPAEAGAVADRIFVGDRDGALWRVDVSSTDPAHWTMKLFFDAFPASRGHDFDDGQPIATPPILSVDPIGNITVAVSTGDQEVLSQTPGMKNYVWSLTEKPDTTGTTMETTVNWYKVFDNGERVTGPMTLFDGSLFFSSFLPVSAASASVCSTGTSTVWGMHYLTKQSNAADGEGGAGRIPDSSESTGFAQRVDVSALLGGDNATVFGVGVSQQPTCSVEDTSAADPFLGFGSHTALTNVNPGTFELVMHVGTGKGEATGGKTNVLRIPLATPSLTSLVDSWATILE